MEHYFNTNNETGETLKESNAKAKSLEEKILKEMKLRQLKYNPLEVLWTPEDFEKTQNTLLTSIRRAFSNLADPEKWNAIEKTDKMTIGKYGKMIHTWKLK